jgi:AraC family transcriptional regulator
MRAGTVESYHERILRVLVHIQKNLDAPLPLDELAGVACFSPFHFHRVFRGMVGESVKEHVRRLRLERAAQWLRHSERPVTQIAFDSGYDSHEAFTRAFRAMFDCAPSEYREARAGASGAAPELPPRARLGTRPAGAPLDVRVEVLGPLRLAFVRHVGPYDTVGATWAKLMAWAGRRGLLGPGMRLLGIVHDDPEITSPEKLRYDAAVVVHGAAEPEGETGVQEIPRGEYGVALHRGPYERLGETYARLCGEWLPRSGREPASAPALEEYHNAPQFTRPENLLTSVYLPLAE